MKKALNLIITYFLFLLVGLVLGTFLYSFYLNVLDFIAGNEIHFFRDTELIQALFYVGYCMLLLICPLISYYRIRHPGGISQTIAYIIVCLITWIVLFPALNTLNNFYNRRHPQNKEQTYLSAGYFRKVDNKVYYFTEEFRDTFKNGISATSVVIDTAEDGEVSVEKVQNVPEFALNSKAEPYREIQVKNNFQLSGIAVPVRMGLLVSKGREALGNGLLKYLGYLSMALLIGVLYMFTYFFEWRLLNTCFLMIASTGVYLMNTFFYLPVTDGIKSKIHFGFFDVLERFIDEPLLTLINSILFLVILILGIIKIAVKKHKEKNR